jgi:hypothetical protein
MDYYYKLNISFIPTVHNYSQRTTKPKKEIFMLPMRESLNRNAFDQRGHGGGSFVNHGNHRNQPRAAQPNFGFSPSPLSPPSGGFSTPTDRWGSEQADPWGPNPTVHNYPTKTTKPKKENFMGAPHEALNRNAFNARGPGGSAFANHGNQHHAPMQQPAYAGHAQPVYGYAQQPGYRAPSQPAVIVVNGGRDYSYFRPSSYTPQANRILGCLLLLFVGVPVVAALGAPPVFTLCFAAFSFALLVDAILNPRRPYEQI